jgi:hypothetical protein
MMKRKILLVVVCTAALWSASAFAVPSASDVQIAVKSGDYPKAETMMREVVAAKPQSAKAHYLYAEILAHDAKFAEAAAQARQARQIDPALTFTTDPEKFRSFERLLEREQAGPAVGAHPATQVPARMNMAPAVSQQAPSGGIPGWFWVGGFATLAFVIFRAVSRRSSANDMVGGAYAPQPQGGYGMNPGMQQPGYGPMPGTGTGTGSGLLGTGLAVAGGLAGGMLLERVLEGDRHDEKYGSGNSFGAQGGSVDSGSGQAASELENRPIDFGTGGNEWGGDAGGGASSDGDDGGGW